MKTPSPLLSLLLSFSHTLTHANTTRTHANTTRTHTHTDASLLLLTCKQTQKIKLVQILTHIQTHTNMHKNTHTPTHLYTCALSLYSLCTHEPTHSHTYTHSHALTLTQISHFCFRLIGKSFRRFQVFLPKSVFLFMTEIKIESNHNNFHFSLQQQLGWDSIFKCFCKSLLNETILLIQIKLQNWLQLFQIMKKCLRPFACSWRGYYKLL